MSYTPESIYTGDISLPEEISNEIWLKARENSAFLSLARRIDLPGRGMSVPVITGDVEAAWVGETERSPISTNTFGVKHIVPYEMSLTIPISKKFARDLPGLYGKIAEEAPKALAALFDGTIAGAKAAPGDKFDTLASVSAFDISEDPYQGFVAANGAIAKANYRANKVVLDANGETILWAAVDDVKRPLFVPSVHDDEIGRVLGKPVSIANNVHVDGVSVDTIGFMGDWSKAVCGIVSDMSFEVAKEATLTKSDGTTIDLFQQRMIAIQLNFEAGFAVQDTDAFAKLTMPADGDTDTDTE